MLKSKFEIYARPIFVFNFVSHIYSIAMIILKSQKNELFRLIELTEVFTPNQFEIEDISGKSRIRFKDSSYFALFVKPRISNFGLECSPGEDNLISYWQLDRWEQVINRFNRWLSYLSREVSEPDLWSRLSENAQLANLSVTESHTQFTVSEYQDLKQKMNALSAQMKALPFLIESQTEIQAKLDHITQLAERMSKFDWTNLFVGVIVSIIIQLNVTPDNATALWNLIRSIFRGYFLN